MVYIREAHAIDGGWPIASDDQPVVEEPLTLVERGAVASACMMRLALEPIPAVVDELDDRVNQAYQAWPDRLVLVDAQGRVAWRGEPGPYGFRPDELEAALRAELGLPPHAPAAAGE